MYVHIQTVGFVGRQGDRTGDKHARVARHPRRALRARRQPLLGGRRQGAAQGEEDVQGHHSPTHRGRAGPQLQRE